MTQFSTDIYTLLKDLLKGENGFAIGNDPTPWANGLRFTIYDVRSESAGGTPNPFDDLIWEIEDQLKAAQFPVAAVLKGQKLCMIDVDCRIKLEAASGSLLTAEAADA